MNWPQYGLRWSGLCCHSGTAWVDPSVARVLVAAAVGPTSAVTEWQHKPRQRTSGQFLFYQENEAIHCDKCSDDEPPGWNVHGWQTHWNGSVHKNSVRIIGQYDLTISSSSCIDDVTITHLFSFETVSGRLGMTAMIFVYLRLHEGSKCK